MAFDKPQSRNEAILQNMLGANNELEPPKSRVEALLQDIAGQMPEANPSEGTTTGTLERLKIGDDIYEVDGGGSGGTSDYDALNNKPQIAGTTLSGNKSLADLGIASATTVSGILDGASIDSFADVETALTGKQGTLTFDNTPTENSANPVKSGGIYSALAGKADTGIVADDFDSTASYVIGNYCIENGKLYRFKANHSGAWSASDVDEIQITGELATLKSGLTTLDDEVNGDATTYDFADVVTIEDAVPSNLADCSVKIEPVQDLHGYDKPWVGGAYKNLCPDKTYKQNSYTMYIGQDDGSSFPFHLKGGTTYTLSYVTQLSPVIIYLRKDGDSSGVVVNSTFTPSETANYRIALTIEGIDSSNVTSIQLELGSTATSYAPYENICPITGHTEASVQRDGVNQWDEQWELGYLNSVTGQNVASANCIRSKNYNPVKGNTTYYVKAPLNTVIFFYDADKNFISYIGKKNTTVLTPSNCSYIRFYEPDQYGTTYNNDISINYPSTDTDYHAYKGKTYTIALGDTIYGGTVDFNTGVMTVTKAIVDLGNVNWGYNDSNFYTVDNLNIAAKEGITNLCSCYDVVANVPYATNPIADKSICTGSLTENRIYAKDTDYDNAADFTTAVTGQTLCYELATPTTIQLTPQQIQLLKGTNTLYASTGDISVTVNGVSGSIGAVQEQVNELAEEVAEIKPVNYSTTEQKTGQKWIDGKDIYFCTFTGLTITTTSNWQDTGIDSSNMDTIIGGLAIDDSKQSIVCSFGFGTNPTVILRAYMSTNVIKSVTLYYTKTT